MTAIIILNWNGYKDTIECLETLYKMQSEFYVIITDNASTDNSVENISHYLTISKIKHLVLTAGECLSEAPSLHECIIYKKNQNLGFAKGNNEALRLIANYLPQHVLLLNNDTLVEPDFLDKLNSFALTHTDIPVLTPMICLERSRNIIWNCGGRMKYGFRRYYYADRPVSEVKEKEFLPISFITGCALFFTPSLTKESIFSYKVKNNITSKELPLLLPDGGIFTERFFFGEEDFNFSMRMNKNKIKMACVLTSKIYHKVSASTGSKNQFGKIYIHYLNRFIDTRQQTSSFFFFLWECINLLYIPLSLFKRRKMSLIKAIKLTLRVAIKARRKNSVSQTDFIEAINQKA